MNFIKQQTYVKTGNFFIYPPSFAQIDLVVVTEDSTTGKILEIPLGYVNPNWGTTSKGEFGYKPTNEHSKVTEYDCFRVINGIKEHETGSNVILTEDSLEKLKRQIFNQISGEITMVRSFKEQLLFQFQNLSLDEFDSLNEEEQDRYTSNNPLVF